MDDKTLLKNRYSVYPEPIKILNLQSISTHLTNVPDLRKTYIMDTCLSETSSSSFLFAQLNQNNLVAANKEKADIMLQSRGLCLPKEETYISCLFYSTLHNICQA